VGGSEPGLRASAEASAAAIEPASWSFEESRSRGHMKGVRRSLPDAPPRALSPHPQALPRRTLCPRPGPPRRPAPLSAGLYCSSSASADRHPGRRGPNRPVVKKGKIMFSLSSVAFFLSARSGFLRFFNELTQTKETNTASDSVDPNKRNKHRLRRFPCEAVFVSLTGKTRSTKLPRVFAQACWFFAHTTTPRWL